MTLSTEQMIEVGHVYNDAFKTVISNMSSNRESILIFVTEMALSEKPYLLVTPEGVERLAERVFGTSAIQDFVLTLSFVFFARWGGDTEDCAHLAENLAMGATQSWTGNEKTINDMAFAVPNQIASRLMKVGDAHQIIRNNPWLMIVLVLILCTNVAAT